MEVSLTHPVRRAPQMPAAREAGPDGEREKLETERQLLQNQVLLMKSEGDAAAASSDAIAMAEKRLEEISAALAAEAPADSAPAAQAPRARFDEYVPEDGQEPAPGLYSVEPDEEGGRRVEFRPYSGDGAEQTTANTDRVDAEIRRLKQEQAALEQRVRRAEEGGAGEPEQLKRRLEGVESELKAKDNDAYRRQHTVFTDE